MTESFFMVTGATCARCGGDLVLSRIDLAVDPDEPSTGILECDQCNHSFKVLIGDKPDGNETKSPPKDKAT